MKYKAIALSVLLLLFSCLCGCEKGSGTYIFKAAIAGNPKTLDPQTSASDSSAGVIYNTFRGLFRLNADGKSEPDMAQTWTVSEDGLEWTFTLCDDVYWYAEDFGEKCTAYDYVFAFRRLVNPAVKSANAADFFVIKNAGAINSGEISDLSALGVEAVDETTLRVSLEYPEPDLPLLLAKSAAMPCSENFFNTTEGRYGLAADCIASNGLYYVRTWNYDKWSTDSNYIILRRNALNTSEDESLPIGVNFFIDESSELTEFTDGALTAYHTDSAEEVAALSVKYRFTAHESAVWGLVFNTQSFADTKLRLAFAGEIVFADSVCYKSAQRITPPFISDDFFSAEAGEFFDAPSVVNVIMPQNKELREQLNVTAQAWRDAFGVSCNVFEPDDDTYFQRLKSGDYDIALVRLDGENSTEYAYLSVFLSDSPRNVMGIKSRKLDHIIESARAELDEQLRSSYYLEAENFLIESAYFVPLCSQADYVFYSGEAAGVEYNSYLGAYTILK